MTWSPRRRRRDAAPTPSCRRADGGNVAATPSAWPPESLRGSRDGVVPRRLKYYQSEVDALSQFHDLKLVDSIALKVATIKQNLARADDDARLYNARESLFGKAVTDYGLLKEIQKKFEPYGNMWESVDSWLKQHKAWLTGPFAELDAESVESSAQTILRTLKKCEKKFESVPGCLEVTRTILKEVAAFVPHLPLIIALRQKGLRERHWEAISAKSGKKVQPDDAWTLSTVFELKLEDDVRDSVLKLTLNLNLKMSFPRRSTSFKNRAKSPARNSASRRRSTPWRRAGSRSRYRSSPTRRRARLF